MYFNYLFMKKLLFILFCLPLAYTASAQMTPGSVVTATNGTIYFLSYTPPNYRSTGTPHPLIISLGGVGEQGDGSSDPVNGINALYVGGIPKKIHDGATNMMFTYNSTTDGFVVLAPQLPKSRGDWANFYVDEMITYATSHFNIDANRIFLTGYSLGGIGTWNYAFSSPNINKLAGIVPISSNTNLSSPDYCNVASNKVAIWAFQGQLDALFGGNTAHNYINSINACSNVVIPGMDTIYAFEVHGADFWDNKVYDPTNGHHYPNVFQWMLMVRKNINIATDANPQSVIAGGPTITLSTPLKISQFPALDARGSIDDDIIVDYLWQQTSGPMIFRFGSSVASSTTTSQWPLVNAVVDPNYGLFVTEGDYKFSLRVKDYLTYLPGHTQSTNVTVSVKIPASGHSAAAVEAGGGATIGSGVTSFTQVRGYYHTYGSIGPNGFSTNWSFVSGPSGAPTPILRDFNNTGSYGGGDYVSFTNIITPGTYTFRYTVANGYVGETNSDVFTLIKLGTLPVEYAYINGANAGNKNVITWGTTSEINSLRFDVMRSTDGVSFSTIGSVNAVGGSLPTNYSFDDNNAPFGVAYYRLSQVDKDGRTELSKTLAVTNSKTGVVIEKYPNPVHDNLAVSIQSNINGNLQVAVADMQGKTIMQQQWQKNQPVLKKNVNVSALQNGVYQIIITIGQEKKVSSFVKY